MSDDYFDEVWFDGPEIDNDEEREPDPENACVECGQDSTDHCVCGNPLCHMHFEIQCGFCNPVSDEEHAMIMKEMGHWWVNPGG